MTQNHQADQPADVHELRAQLRRDLGVALKTRRAEAVAASLPVVGAVLVVPFKPVPPVVR